MSIEGQGHFFTIYFPGFVCLFAYYAKISSEHLQDHWSSGFIVALPEPSIYNYISKKKQKVILQQSLKGMTFRNILCILIFIEQLLEILQMFILLPVKNDTLFMGLVLCFIYLFVCKDYMALILSLRATRIFTFFWPIVRRGMKEH